MSVLDYKPTHRCARDSKRPLARASWDDVLKYGGGAAAMREIRKRGLLPPIAGGALSLVTSGTTTPTVGTNSALDTETPGSPTTYVMEVDTSVMQTGDVAMLTVRNTANNPKPTALSIGTGLSASAAAMTVNTSVVPVGAPVLVVAGNTGTTTAPGTPTDTELNTYSSIQSATATLAASLYGVANPLPIPGGDWLGSLALSQSDQLTIPATGAVNLFAACCVMGASFVPTPYASATAAASSNSPSVTSGTVTNGDLVIGAIVWSNGNIALTQPGSWGNVFNRGTSGNPGAAMASFIATSTTTFTYNPTLSGTTAWRAFVAAIPAMSGGTPIARLGVRGRGQVEQSHPILVNTSASVEFDLLQTAGTARAFPWKIWKL